MNLRVKIIDERHQDELYARRIEMLPIPPEADQTTSAGTVVFHTAWLHYRDNVVFSESIGPRIEKTFEQVMARSWEVPISETETVTIPTALVFGAVLVAFDTLANEHLTIPPPPDDFGPPVFTPIEEGNPDEEIPDLGSDGSTDGGVQGEGGTSGSTGDSNPPATD